MPAIVPKTALVIQVHSELLRHAPPRKAICPNLTARAVF
jgi:hypothetical protein